MHERDIDGVIGQLEVGIGICEATQTMLVHIPVEDAREILEYLRDFRKMLND